MNSDNREIMGIFTTFIVLAHLPCLAATLYFTLTQFDVAWILLIFGQAIQFSKFGKRQEKAQILQLEIASFCLLGAAHLFGFQQWAGDPGGLALLLVSSVCLIRLSLEFFVGSRLSTQKIVQTRLPDTKLESSRGQVSVRDVLRSHSLFVFFRGTWCGYCMAQIKEIHLQQQKFRELGIQIYLVSNQSLDHLQKTEGLYPESFTLLSDTSLELAKQLNLVHKNGTVLPARGTQSADTIFPTVLLTNSEGEIIEVFQTENYQVRPDPAKYLKRFKHFLADTALKSTIQEKNLEIAQSLEQKKKLLGVLVHDLANPLTVILSSAAIAEKTQEPSQEKQQKLWTRVLRAGKTIREIIDSTRELMAVESGKLQSKSEPVSLLTVVEHCNFLFADPMSKKNLQLQFDGEKLKDISVLADPGALKNQVLANLISNAIKFSEQGSTIKIVAKETDSRVLLSVKDTGVGIPDALIPKLFDPNTPTTRTGTSGEKGTGFGLPLVKAYVESFEGEIHVTSQTREESPEAHGTSFHLTLKSAA